MHLSNQSVSAAVATVRRIKLSVPCADLYSADLFIVSGRCCVVSSPVRRTSTEDRSIHFHALAERAVRVLRSSVLVYTFHYCNEHRGRKVARAFLKFKFRRSLNVTF